MGGYNSGRYRVSRYLGQLTRLDVLTLREVTDGSSVGLTWPASGSSISVIGTPVGLSLQYAVDGESIAQLVRVDALPCNYGGTRPLFVCPHCSRRARFLYYRWKRFLCRPCIRLRYWTQAVTPDTRMVHRIRKLQRRLAPDIDPDDYVVEFVPKRPSGMRRRTYNRLKSRILDLAEARDAYLEPALLRALARLGVPLEGMFD